VIIDPKHVANAVKARDLYLDNLRPEESSADWRFAVREARKLVAASLRASDFLSDMGKALESNGGHSLVFRQLLAPPMSQDQFKLVCPQWNKSSENGKKPLRVTAASAAALVLKERLDLGVVTWLQGTRPRSRRDLTTLLRVASTLMALQKVSTARRTRLAFEQEYATVKLLSDSGWKQLPSKLLDTRAAVPPMHFMHKTRFATNTTTPQEVDIACGLQGGYVLAMECKVTNDETNSVKRINDVLKKAKAWKDHWGSFVITAALLQGVIAAKDVQRLTDGGVDVFWSHDLNEFEMWLSSHIAS
jgi:hypothetical protein